MGTGSDAMGFMVVRRKKGSVDGKQGGLLKETRVNAGGAGTVASEREKYGTKEWRHRPRRRDIGKARWQVA